MRKIAGIGIPIVVVAAFSFMLVGAILPGAWTHAFGEQTATPANLHTGDRGRGKKSRCRFSVAGGELGRQLLNNEICLTEEQYRQLPQNGEMLLEGRRRVFGTLVTNVSVEKSVEAP